MDDSEIPEWSEILPHLSPHDRETAQRMLDWNAWTDRMTEARANQEDAINRSLVGMVRFMEADEGCHDTVGSEVAQVRKD